VKHLSFFILALFAFSSCAENTAGPAGPEQMANTFLQAYFDADFATAAPLCSEELHEDMNHSLSFFNNLSEAEQAQTRTDLQAYIFKIEKTQLNPTKDSATVLYRVYLRDSTGITASSIRLVKQEEGWKVDKIL